MSDTVFDVMKNLCTHCDYYMTCTHLFSPKRNCPYDSVQKFLDRSDGIRRMSMTENEAIKNINALNAVCLQKDFYDEEFARTLTTAIQALEEIQQYRAIGTVEGYERAIQISIENYNLYKEYKAKVQEFEAIGTVEEFKALKEK